MALPAQVRKQSEAVNKLYEELNAENEQAVDTTEPEQEGVEEASQGGKADSVAKEAPATRQKNEQKAVVDDEEETFEKRYRSLQGMYNAEVPRLHAEKRELAGRVQQLEQLIATMNAPAAQPQTAAEKLVTEQDIEEYGDSIDVMRKVYREEVSAQQARINQLEQLIRQMQTTVVPQVHQLSHNHAVSTEQRFWADLQTAVPDWQDVNANRDFQSWLLEVDPLTGINRQTYLDDAQRNLDARRVASFFQTWKGLSGVPDAQSNRTAQPSQLEKQVAPGRGRSGTSRAAGEPKTYSSDDIKQFFTDVQKGKYKGREDERDRIERDIFAAQREGRIVTA